MSIFTMTESSVTGILEQDSITGGESGGTMRDVDAVDLKLVRYLLDNPRASYAEVSRATGVSETTVKRRVEALIDTSVITPAFIPDVRRLGFHTIAIVGMKVDLNQIQATAETIRDLPQVTSIHMTLGRYDLMATVAERTLNDLRLFLIDHIAPLPGIRDIESNVSTRALKILRDWRIPQDLNLTDPVMGGDEIVQEQA